MVLLMWHSEKSTLVESGGTPLAGQGGRKGTAQEGLAWNLASALQRVHTLGQLPEGTFLFPSTHPPERMLTPELWGGSNLCTIAVPSFHGNQTGSERLGVRPCSGVMDGIEMLMSVKRVTSTPCLAASRLQRFTHTHLQLLIANLVSGAQAESLRELYIN